MRYNSDILTEKLNINNLGTDYRAEIVALNIIKFYKGIDQVLLKRLGSNNRNFKKDIDSISLKFYGLDETIVSLETFRESIYDYLPEGVFHTPTLGNAYDDIDNIVSKIKKQREVEDNARKLFEPFELESYFAELSALFVENEYNILDGSTALVDTISQLWPLLNELDKETSRIFIYLLPFFHSVRGNKKWFEKCLMAFLQVPVSIIFIPNVIKNTEVISEDINDHKTYMGVSTILSGDHMDGQRNWCINIGPIPYENIHKYVPGSNLRKILYRLYDYCVPLNMEVIEEFVTERNETSHVLSDDYNTSVLGYSTFL